MSEGEPTTSPLKGWGGTPATESSTVSKFVPLLVPIGGMMSVVTRSSPEYVVTLDEPGSKLNVVAGIAGVHDGHAVVDVGPISVSVAGADSPLKKSFCMIASRVLLEPRGP